MSEYTRDLKGSTQYREMAVETRAIDEEARTVELAFSSEQPVDRMWFVEVLDHRSKSVRVGALNDGAPLLADHERNQQIGVIESGTARIDSDKVGRARVRFSKRGRGADEFQDVIDGIRTKVSVGYRIHDFEESRADKDSPITVRVTDWEPLEVSLVSMPADSSVGVGRSDSTMENPMTEETKTEVTDVTETRVEPAPSVDIDAERRAAADKAKKEDRVRAEKIFGAADIYPSNTELQSLAKQCARDGTSFSDFQERAFPLIAKKQEMISQDEPVSKLGMERGEIEQFSIMRAIRCLHDQANGGKSWRETAPFEWRCTREIEDKLGRESKGLFVPYDVQRSGSWISPGKAAAMLRQGRIHPMQLRVPMDTTQNADLVPTDHLAADYITALRTQTVVLQWGARELGGLVGNVDIPKTAQNAGFTWLAEDAASTTDDVLTTTVTLTPHTTSSSVRITRRLRKQSSPDVEMLVRDDLVEGAAISIDLAALQGSGVGPEPVGIMSAADVTAVTTTAGNPSWANVIDMETAVANANGLMGSLGYVGTAGVRGAMKQNPRDAGSGLFVQMGEEVNGYPMYMQTGLATNTFIFGNGQDILMGMWGVLDIRVDTATDAAKDGTYVRVFQDVDIALRHGESFAKGSLV